MKKYFLSINSFKKTAVTVALMLIVYSGYSFTELSLISNTCNSPVVFIPDSLQSNLSNVTIDINIGTFWGTTDPSYSNTVSLTDTTNFQYLGYVILDPTDSVGSILYAYRYISTAFTPDVAGITLGDLEIDYNGQYFWDLNLLRKNCIACPSCMSRYSSDFTFSYLVNDVLYGNAITSYFSSYNSLSSYQQQQIATMMNWTLNNNAANVTDYADLLNPSYEGNSTIPTVFCSDPASNLHNSCRDQKRLLDLVNYYNTVLSGITTDDFDDFNTFSDNVSDAFLQYCVAFGGYFPYMYSTEGPDGYEVGFMPLQADLPTVISSVVFDGGNVYTTVAYSYNYSNLDSGIVYTGGGNFAYDDGFYPANQTEGDIPFPNTTVAANGPVIFCSGDSVILSTDYDHAQYNWSTGDTTATITVGVQGSYTVTVQTGTCAASLDTVNVTIWSAPVANAGDDTAICSGFSVVLGSDSTGTGGSGSYTFLWSPSAGLSDSTTANPIATPAVTTMYVLMVTDSNGCKGRDTITVTIHSLPVANAGDDTAICSGFSANLGGSPTGTGGAGGYIYTWSPATGLNDSTQSNPVATPLTTARYAVIITDSNGCVGNDTVNVTIWPLPVANTGDDTSICNGFNVVLGGSPTGTGGAGPYIYTWSPSSGLNDSTQNNPLATPASTTTYSLTITDANGCIGMDTVNVAIWPLPVANTGDDTAICSGLSVVLGVDSTGTGGTGSYIYAWSPSAGLNDSTQSNPLATPIITTTYTVVITDANGCSGADTANVMIWPLPVAFAGDDTAICFGLSVNLGGSPTGTGGTGNYIYTWTPSPGLNDSTQSNPVATPLVTTTYGLIITDSNGCVGSDTVNVTILPLPVAYSGDDTSICSGFSVNLGGNPIGTGGTGSYIYTWSPSSGLNDSTQSNPLATPPATTTYTVIITDSNGCVGSDTVNVTIWPLPVAYAGNDTAICSGLSVVLGTDSTGTGGTGTYIYTWSPSVGLNDSAQSNPVATPGSTTTYSLTITDANGCIGGDTVNVTIWPLPVAYAGDDTAICSGFSATIGGSPTGEGGTGSYIYTWSPSAGLNDSTQANPLAAPTSATTYSLTITDANGCVGSDTVNVIVSLLQAYAGDDTFICSGLSVILGGDSSAGNGIGTYSYLWSPSAGLNDSALANPTANPPSTTSYILTATDSLGCVASDTVNITLWPLPVANAGDDTSVCFGISVILGADSSGTGGNGVYSYLWSPSGGLDNATNPNPTATPADTTAYVLTVTDGNGCMDSDTVIMMVNPVPSPPIAPAPQTACSGSTTTFTFDSVFAMGCDGDIVDWSYDSTFTMWSATAASPATITWSVSPGQTAIIWIRSRSSATGLVSSPVSTTATVNSQPSPPIAPAPQTACSGSATTFTFDSVFAAGCGGDMLDWSSDSTFSMYYNSVYSPATINLYANPGQTSTIWIRSRNSTTGLVSSAVSTSATVNSQPSPPIAPAPQTACSGSATTFTFDSVFAAGCGGDMLDWSSDSTFSMYYNSVYSPATINLYANPGQTSTIWIRSRNSATGLVSSAVSTSATVNSQPSPPVAPTPQTACSTDAVTFTFDSVFAAGCGGDMVDWSINDSTLSMYNSASSPANISLNVNPGQTYTLWIRSRNSYTGLVSSPVSTGATVNIPPSAPGTLAPLSVCSDSAYTFTFSGVSAGAGADKIEWATNSNFDSSTIVSSPGNISVTVNPGITDTIWIRSKLSITGCVSDSIMTTATINLLPTANTGDDTAICSGFSVILGSDSTGTGGAGSYIYAWSPSASLNDSTQANPVATPTSNTTYYLVATDGNGCVGQDSVMIIVNATPSIPTAPVAQTTCSDTAYTFTFSGVAGRAGETDHLRPVQTDQLGRSKLTIAGRSKLTT